MADPLNEAAWREVGPILDEELNRLPENYRAPLVLCCLEGKTHAQAAAELGWPTGSLSKRLRQGRELLRRRLARRGVTPAVVLAVAALTLQAARAAMPRLIGPTTRSAVAFAAGQTPTAAATLARVALADGVLRGLAAGPAKVLTVFLVATMAVLGAVILTHQAGKAEPQKQAPTDGQPPGVRKEETPRPPSAQARTDRHGDPLPDGALARVGTMRLWHGGYRYPLAYAPDGKAIAACEWGEFIRLWDTSTGKEIRRFRPAKGGIDVFAFSPDGKMLVSGDFSSPELRVWSVTTGKELRRVTTEAGGVRAVAFAPDGKTFAAATRKKSILLWDPASWETKGQLPGHGDGTTSIAFLPDNKTLISGGSDNTIRWQDVTTGREVRRLDRDVEHVYDLAVSPDGKTLAGVSFHTLYLWGAETAGEISRTRLCQEYSSWQLAFSPDGRVLACAGSVERGKHKVLFFEAATGRELRRWDEDRYTTNLAYSPDGKVLAQTSAGMIRLRDVKTGKPVVEVPRLPDWVTTVAFTPDGKSLLTCCWGGPIGFWDPLTGKPHGDMKPPPEGYAAAQHDRFLATTLTADGRRAALADSKGSVHLWETATGKVTHRINEPPVPESWHLFSPDGKLLAVKHNDDQIRLWDPGTGRLLRPLSLPGKYAYPRAFSPDGSILATRSSSSEDKSIRFWDTATGKELRRLTWQDDTFAHLLAFSPDGKVLISTHEEGKRPTGPGQDVIPMRAWDVATGRELHQFQGAGRWVSAPAVSPDGKTLAGAVDRSTIVLWEMATGKERGRFRGHGDGINSLAFSPDGRLLASGSHDYTALVWDVTGLSPDGKLPALDLRAEEIERLWSDLGDEDGVRSYRALWTLVAAAPRSLPVLAERLRPVAAVENEKLTRLIAALDSDQFAARQKAAADLARLGELAEPALRKALAGNVSAEARKHLEELLDRVERRALSPEQLHSLRGLEVVEQIGTPEARRLLETLAKGAPAARLTQEAQAALRRLSGQRGGQ
jgi:WD40 repeat protein